MFQRSGRWLDKGMALAYMLCTLIFVRGQNLDQKLLLHWINLMIVDFLPKFCFDFD